MNVNGKLAIVLLACSAGLACAQSSPPTADETAKRIEALEREVQELKSMLKQQMAQPKATAPAAAPAAAPAPAGGQAAAKPAAAAQVEQRMDEQDKRLDDLEAKVGDVKQGTQSFHLGGFIETSFNQPQHGDSTFGAAFKPVFLWKFSENAFAAGAAEFEIDNNDTKANIEYAYLGYNLTDWLSVRGGIILHPLSNFQQSLHPAWINLLPDNPLFADDGGLAPEKGAGFEARGAVNTSIGKINYTAWVTNGPSLITSGDGAGTYSLDEFSDVNGNKAIGARIGYQPIAPVELFYGIQHNDVIASDAGLPGNNALMHDFGVSYTAEPSWARGRIDARAEFMVANLQDQVDLGSGPFSNDRSGGFIQLGYRPTKLESFLKDLEPVVRFDFLNAPSEAPDPADHQRWTVGLDYWVNPRMVVKAAYEFDDVKDPSGAATSNNAFMLQAVVGF